jgi:AbrB family looped-hinge helix DNA binding protein
MHYIYHMVKIMEETTTVDKQGRLIVPARFREALGFKEVGKVTLRLDGSRLMLEPVPLDIKENIREWAEQARRAKSEALIEEPEESWKWMSREYAWRKLGLS